jgi:surface polysaccharide O-acyltransferase-like enzyme
VQERLQSIDYLKALLAGCVVWAHAVLLTGYVSVPAYLFGQGLVRLAVPGFAVLSGYLFHRTWSRGKALPWVAGLLVVYAFWCLFYLPIWLDGSMGLADIALVLLVGPIHLWYVAALALALVLMTAILATADPTTALNRLKVLAPLCLLAGFSLQAVDFFTAHDIPLNGYRNGLFVEFPYAAFGFLIAARVHRLGPAALPPVGVLVIALVALAALRLVEAALSMHFFGLSVVAPPEFPPLAAGFCVTLLLICLRLRLPAPPVPLGFISMAVYFLHYMALLGLLSLGLTRVTLLTGLGIALPVVALLVAARLRLPLPMQASRRT